MLGAVRQSVRSAREWIDPPEPVERAVTHARLIGCSDGKESTAFASPDRGAVATYTGWNV